MWGWKVLIEQLLLVILSRQKRLQFLFLMFGFRCRFRFRFRFRLRFWIPDSGFAIRPCKTRWTLLSCEASRPYKRLLQYSTREVTNACTKDLVSTGLRNLRIRLMLCRWKKAELQSLLIWVDILSWESNQEPKFLTTGFVFTTDPPTVILLMSTLASCCLVPRSKNSFWFHGSWWCAVQNKGVN